MKEARRGPANQQSTTTGNQNSPLPDLWRMPGSANSELAHPRRWKLGFDFPASDILADNCSQGATTPVNIAPAPGMDLEAREGLRQSHGCSRRKLPARAEKEQEVVEG